MKFGERIKSSFYGMKKSAERFPITIVTSIILTMFLIYYRESGINLEQNIRDNLIKLNMIIGMGIPLSLSIGLLMEAYDIKKINNKIIGYFIGLICLISYYHFGLRGFNYVSLSRYMGIIIFLILSILYLNRIKVHNNYEKYTINIFNNFFISVLYSLVLLFGIFIILFTIDNLFDIDINSKIYYYVFLIISLVFFIALFLSKYPEKEEKFSSYHYPKSLMVLLSYIVIPLITIYTLILYIYFLKILITWSWPKGLVSHLVIWYSAVSIGVIFLISPIFEENIFCKLFKIYFPKLNLPILLMMFISIGQRIEQYGITENRYYIVVFGIWITAMMIYYSMKKSFRNIIIPVSLSFVVLISVVGPFNSFSVSKYSQNRRLENTLLKNNMISENKIISNKDLNREAKKEIINIMEYFNTKHSLEDIKVLDENFKLEHMEKVFGFKYEDYNDIQNHEYFYYTRDKSEEIDISGYDYLIDMEGYTGNRNININDIKITYYGNKELLEIIDKNQDKISIKLNDILLEKYNDFNTKGGPHKEIRSQNEMTYEAKNKNIKFKIVFDNISVYVPKSGEQVTIETYDYKLFIINK
ncbi:DUF4153 domain-containing protein [Wansuia hejianensis]|uniref:DUF4153 domain-containing protein n=1 Tax=Wansuia hejianensis TaxID=2763667 RepID=A0A926F047_9FIRM|nr:DUF4153 domain-containing protein [Wansuia hejianensis]MBC8589582.1 DUF4153 domain-containing protein [Wansuia hejianensis]